MLFLVCIYGSYKNYTLGDYKVLQHVADWVNLCPFSTGGSVREGSEGAVLLRSVTVRISTADSTGTVGGV